MDGTMISSTLDQYVTMQEIPTFEPSFVPSRDSTATLPNGGRPDFILQSNDMGTRIPTRTNSTGDDAAVYCHLNHHPSTPEDVTAYQSRFFTSIDAGDQCSMQLIGVAGDFGLSLLGIRC